MQPSPTSRLPWIPALAVVTFFIFLGLANAAMIVARDAYTYRPTAWSDALVLGLADGWTWAILSPLLLWLGRRFPIARRVWVRRVILLAAAGVVLAVLKVQAESSLIQALSDIAVKAKAVEKFYQSFLVAWIILGVAHAMDYYRRFRDGERAAARLETELARAQLHALEMQLHPHFLFNTLNAISTLMRKDLNAAERMLIRLSALLRQALETVNRQEIPLRREMDFVANYLAIEQIRFGDRLTVRQHVAPDILDAAVPVMLLQPLAENAIRLGIAKHRAPGTIEIEARAADGRLCLTVRDNGPGIPPNQDDLYESGVGLRNTRQRLRQLYGEAHRFE